MLKTKNGKVLDLSSAKEIGSGGEGKIYEHPSNKKRVVKVYHTPRNADYANHLQALSKLGNEFIKPKEIYYNDNGRCAGFEMDYVNFSKYWLFNNLFNKGFCNTNSLDKSFKIKVLENLKRSIEEIHNNDIIIGDLNQYNLFFNNKAEIVFVDVDSYASKVCNHSGVLLDDIRDWTTLDINKNTDNWAFDILSFWTLSFCHPFKWVAPGNKDSLEYRVKHNMSFLRNISGMKVPALYEPPMGEIKKQFEEIFAGRRYMIDFQGVAIPVHTQIKVQVSSNSLIVKEVETGISEVFCSGKVMSYRKGTEWTLMEVVFPKVYRIINKITADKVFPGTSNFAVLNGNTLESAFGNKITFGNPSFDYYQGSLQVLDYDNDKLINFDLDAQIGGSLGRKETIVFAKSFTVRDCTIQNFGAKKYIIVPNKMGFLMRPVANDIKNGIFCEEYIAIESKTKTSTDFYIQGPKGRIDLDYFPHFMKRGDMIFVPEDGKIVVYKDYVPILELDCSVCTRSSKLFNSKAGIFLLENSILYLLNTK